MSSIHNINKFRLSEIKNLGTLEIIHITTYQIWKPTFIGYPRIKSLITHVRAKIVQLKYTVLR